jgi:hypothetical protein
MNLDMAGVDHQPFIVRLINQLFQQGFPDSFIPPGSAGTQNPERRLLRATPPQPPALPGKWGSSKDQA